MQRVIINAPDKLLVDHINGDPLDNRKSNLRLATKSQNMRNRKKAHNNKSGYKGVWFDYKRDKWVAYIKINGSSKTLGRFINKEEAAARYDEESRKLFGEYARPNNG